MGKAKKNHRRRGDESEEEGDEERHSIGGSSNTTTTTGFAGSPASKIDYKSLDFAQRRQLQRQAAQEKRRSKMKCYLCGQTGHVRRECPGIVDDGRGMSRFKAKYSDTKTAVAKHNVEREQRKKRQQGERPRGDSHSFRDILELPFGFLRDADGSSEHQADEDSPKQLSPSPSSPFSLDNNFFCYHDTNCDIDAMLTYVKSGRGKHRLSQAEALHEMQEHLDYAVQQSNLGGFLSKSWLRKRRPWIPPAPAKSFLEAWQGTRLFYVVGLSPTDFVLSKDLSADNPPNHQDDDEAIDALCHAIDSNASLIAGFFATLDYSADGLGRKGCSKDNQMARLRWTCLAAGKCNLAVQIQVHPGILPIAASHDHCEETGETKGTQYAQVLLDLQQILSTTLETYPELKIHLSAWSGSPEHMVSFCKAFPTLMVGLDSSLTFQKAKHLHESAFELDLSRLVLETNNVIPSQVANCMGRDAFSHPGLIPFIAATVAKHSKYRPNSTGDNHDLMDGAETNGYAALEVARKTASAAVALYPLLAKVSSTCSC